MESARGQHSSTRSWRATAALAALAAVLFGVPLAWGTADADGLAPDEILPRFVDTARSHGFANGWAHVYPPVTFYLLAAAHGAADLVTGSEDWHARTRSRLLAGRLLAAALAVATVLLIRELGARLGLSAGATVAALLWTASPSVAYYAKTANAESFYLFFLVLALVLLQEYVARQSPRSLLAAGLVAATAVAAKDQAAFLLAGALAAAVAGATLRRSRDGAVVPPRCDLRALLAAAGTALASLVALALLFNLPANVDGARRHLELLRSLPENAQQRAHGSDLAGRLEQASAMGGTLVFVIGIAGAALAAAGAWVLARDGERRRRFAPLLAGTAVHLGFFWLAVPRSYDRLLLPAAVAGVLVAGAGWDALAGARWRRPALVRALLGAALVFSLLRAVELDLRLLFDSREEVGRWIARDGGRRQGTWVLGREVWSSAAGSRIRPGDPERLGRALREHRPRHLVAEPDLVAVPRYAAQLAGAGYREVHRTAGRVPARLSGPGRPARSNLEKISPELVILRRSD